MADSGTPYLAGRRFDRRALLLSLLLAAAFGGVGFGVTIHATGGHLVWSDGVAYFLYARSLLLDGDADLSNEYHELRGRNGADDTEQWLAQLRDWSRFDPESGRLITPWPAGAGAVMVPFYALGYAAELALAGPQRRPDSYGLAAQVGYATGSLAYGLLGFWALVYACRRVTAPADAYLAALGVTFAGPLTFYLFVHPSMAHAASFGLAAAVIALWLRQWQQGLSLPVVMLLGFLCGLLVTVRYQNLLFGLLPAVLLLRELRRRPARALVAAGVGLLGAAPPLLLALLAAGQTSEMTSPAAPGAWQLQLGPYPFDLRSPYFWEVLWSCRHGAFHWAPLLALGVVGLLAARNWAWVLLAGFAAQVYLIGALGLIDSGYRFDDWLNHWHGAPSFGMRYLTAAGALLAPGLALLLCRLRTVTGRVWPAALLVAAAAAANGLLVLAYGLGTVSRSACVGYADMAAGVVDVVRRFGF